jgi:hypothetical protein
MAETAELMKKYVGFELWLISETSELMKEYVGFTVDIG